MEQPFLSVLLLAPKTSQQLGKRLKTAAQVTGQVVKRLRRTSPGRPIHLVGDGAYAVIELGLVCQRYEVTLLAPLRLNARLFEAPATPDKKRRGRPALVGARLLLLADVANASWTRWPRSQVAWYGATTAILDWTTGAALWYSTGSRLLPIR